jgi:DNA invertase Pin-like site-specific DNA recombinase
VHAMSNPGSLLLSRKPRRRHQRMSRRFCALRVDELYRGRPEDIERNESIATMLKAGLSYSAIQAATDCSRATVAKIAKRIQGERPFEASASVEAA